MDDEKIVDMLWQRSEEALEEIKKKYGGAMFSISKNILKNESDAEECLNDAYLGIWNSVPPNRPDPFPPYIFKIIRNISIRRLKNNNAEKRDGRKNVNLDQISDILPDKTDVSDIVSAAELTEILNGFLHTLDKTNLYVFMRKYWYFETVPEISEKLGMTEYSVYMRLDRMKKRLLKYLNEKGVTV